MVLGPRGDSWGSVDQPMAVRDLVDEPATTDLYVCGPSPWAQQVADDARASGLKPDAIHLEKFGW
ncbi:hypothetical protein GCM10025876_32200 [Demequina litorisediminis]|uniref:Uncharacterized protein n=1 Tax=Demequina litorisediminis TaxID=1849022 RepID=A0ABQ6IH09_9MICO|nr:hypothetical protein GCM10025876_32200 [Demequina litorisediminis]